MKNCSDCPEKLRENIMNITKHYQNQHDECATDSPCQHATYQPSKIVLSNPNAIAAYEKILKDTLIYRYAESYCRVSIYYLHKSETITK
jgi:hypothetical protein